MGRLVVHRLKEPDWHTSRNHPVAQLNSLSLNIYFNSHRFHAHFPLSFSGTRAPLDNPPQPGRQWRSGWQMSAMQSLAMPWADGGSAAGAAAGAPWNRNKVYTGFAHECAERRKCWHKNYTRDAKLQKSLLTVWSEAEIYTQQAKTLRNSLHMTGQSWYQSLYMRWWNLHKSWCLHNLSKMAKKFAHEQTCVNLCKLSSKFTQACLPMDSITAVWAGNQKY